MDSFHVPPLHSALNPEWTLENVTTTIFKCTRWQVEETTDLINCPFHYFCNSAYPGNYPALVDLSVLFFTASIFLSTTFFTLLNLKGNLTASSIEIIVRRRYFLPSGPIGLPLILLIFAKGNRINTIFPLMHTGPALLQLAHVSALAFQNNQGGGNDVQYAILEASTISGILHASLYLDYIILPFYTGLEVLTKSTFSGECPTCVCRREPLVVGGQVVRYRGWSTTTWSIVAALCASMLSRIYGEDKLVLWMKNGAQGLAWVLVAFDAVYFVAIVPQSGVLCWCAYGGVCVLILLKGLEKIIWIFMWLGTCCRVKKRMHLRHKDAEIV